MSSNQEKLNDFTDPKRLNDEVYSFIYSLLINVFIYNSNTRTLNLLTCNINPQNKHHIATQSVWLDKNY